MKRYLKKLVVAVLARQVRSLSKKHEFKVVGVAGSIGKTSTKLAIAQTLGKSLRVRYQQGNYNDIVSVPLIFFGHEMPSLTNPVAWVKLFMNNSAQIRGSYPYDVVVVELGTDAPGQILEFKKYLQLDVAVMTAVTPEHMENFGDLKAVADEELSVASYSQQIIYNADLIPAEYQAALREKGISYSLRSSEANYHIANIYKSFGGFEGDIKYGNDIFLHFLQEVPSEIQLYSTLAATVTGHLLGLKPAQILEGLEVIKPVNGRLRRLRGINGSTIIDDTYNSSPDALKAGLEMLYKQETSQRIAILGSMNELGAMSPDAHKQIGEFCDPSFLSIVVTIGSEANKYLAPAAEAKGCHVKSFDSPYEAGDFLQGFVEPGAVIFAKGSQNGVFAEEAVRKLLADPEDAAKLVRQSPEWQKKKASLNKTA